MQRLLRLFWSLLMLGVCYEGCRLFFLMLHRNLFTHNLVSQVAATFWYGLRFDAAAILFINGLYLLALILPPRLTRQYLQGWNLWFAISNGFFMLVNLGDTEYFQFTGKRLTWGSLAIIKDIREQAFQISAYYWYYPIIALGLIVLFYQAQLKLTLPLLESSQPMSRQKARWLKLGEVIATLLVIGMGTRGGMQTKPLHIAHAMEFAGDPNLAQLTLNSSFTLLRSGKQKHLQPVHYLPNWDAVVTAINEDQVFAPIHPLAGHKTNVVIVILESFNLEYMGLDGSNPSYTPFLNELSQKGTFFVNHFANGRRSIDALPSILAGLPNLMEDPFITSPYQSNQVIGLPSLLKKQGYDTYFFHGGHNGTMFFDAMAKMFGVEHYVGENEYPYSGHFDGQWGIFDEPFLQYVVERLDRAPAPFMASVFTLSSHHPYTIPSEYKGRFPKGSLEIHESIGYTDYALRRFFETAAKKPWFSNTLFILTADHTSKSSDQRYDTPIGRFRVPLIFYHPGQPRLPLFHPESLVEQADIMPTVLNLLGVPVDEPMARFGHSLVSDTPKKLTVPIVFHGSGNYWMVADDFAMHYGDSGELVFFNWHLGADDHHVTIPPQEELHYKNFLESRIQYFVEGMLENRINISLKK